MENKAKVAVLAIEICTLSLPTELILELSNCYYVLNITRNIISISCLVMNGYSFQIRNNSISIMP